MILSKIQILNVKSQYNLRCVVYKEKALTKQKEQVLTLIQSSELSLLPEQDKMNGEFSKCFHREHFFLQLSLPTGRQLMWNGLFPASITGHKRENETFYYLGRTPSKDFRFGCMPVPSSPHPSGNCYF